MHKKTCEKKQAEGKIINVNHLMSYLKSVEDGRKLRGICCDLGNHIGSIHISEVVWAKQSIWINGLGEVDI